jgi:hypothetical protein
MITHDHVEAGVAGALAGLASLTIQDTLPFFAKLIGAGVIAWVSGWAYAKGKKRAGGKPGDSDPPETGGEP